jgi:hypothetical protein
MLRSALQQGQLFVHGCSSLSAQMRDAAARAAHVLCMHAHAVGHAGSASCLMACCLERASGTPSPGRHRSAGLADHRPAEDAYLIPGDLDLVCAWELFALCLTGGADPDGDLYRFILRHLLRGDDRTSLLYRSTAVVCTRASKLLLCVAIRGITPIGCV